MNPTQSDRGYPTGLLLVAISLSAAGLAILWTVVRLGWGFTDEIYKGGLLGLAVATVAHIGGTFVGAFLAPGKGVSSAYMASTVVRFLATPLLAVSLYFALPVAPQPLLIGSAAGYLLILVADVGAMLRSTRGTAGSASL